MRRTSKVVNDIPNFYSYTDLDGCDVCFTCNMRRTAAGHVNTRIDTMKVNKLLRLEWGFMMNKYHDK